MNIIAFNAQVLHYIGNLPNYMERSDTFELLRQATRLLRHERTRALPDLSLAKLSALATVAERGGVDVEGLATEELVSGPAIVETVKALVESGLVNREAHSGDRRRVLLRITKEGRKQLEADRKSLDRLFVELTERERAALTRAAVVLRSMGSRAPKRES